MTIITSALDTLNLGEWFCFTFCWYVQFKHTCDPFIMQFTPTHVDTKSSVHTLYFDSRHAEGRNPATETKLVNCAVCRYECIRPIQYVQAMGVEHLRIPSLWSRLPIDANNVDINPASPSLADLSQPWVFGYQIDLTTNNGSSAVNRLFNVGTITQFPQGAFLNAAGPSNPYLAEIIRKREENGLSCKYNAATSKFEFAIQGTALWAKIIDTQAARRLFGIRDFSVQYTSTDFVPETPLAVVRPNIPPPLYLHVNVNLRTEQNRAYPNIIHCIQPGNNPSECYQGIQNYNNGEVASIEFFSSAGAYVDRERLTIPIDLNTSERTVDRLQLTWRMQDGLIADMTSLDWQIRLLFYTRNPYENSNNRM